MSAPTTISRHAHAAAVTSRLGTPGPLASVLTARSCDTNTPLRKHIGSVPGRHLLANRLFAPWMHERHVPTFVPHDGLTLSYRTLGEGVSLICLPGGPCEPQNT